MSQQSPRKSLTRNQRAELFLEHSGRCYLCGCIINAGRGEAWEVEHVEAREISGRDDWANLRPAHVDCHKVKTKEDKAIIAKCNRVRNKHLGIRKRTSFRGWRKMNGDIVFNKQGVRNHGSSASE
jgi:5-methylcytosine-specific restriction endonuclease McrA